MKYHIHIPKLEEFALYSSCDSVTKHGTAGLKRPMNRPLYYRCMMTYAAKKCNILTVYQAYKQLRTGSFDLKQDQLSVKNTLHGAMMLLDHAVLNDSVDIAELRHVIKCLFSISHVDVNASIECIHRFATRCIALGNHSLLTTVMSETLEHSPCKKIRDVAVPYGGKVTIGYEESLWHACRCGLLDDIKQIVDSGDELSEFDMNSVVESGDVDAIRYVATQLGDKRKLTKRHEIVVDDLTPPTCEILLSLGVFERGSHLNVGRVSSIPTLQWVIEHDVIEVNDLYGRFANNVVEAAVDRGGPYADVLRYLVEVVHMELPVSTLAHNSCASSSDLGVLDYVISHGVQVNQGAAFKSPLLLRYWMDRGLKIDDVNDFCWRACTAQFQGGCSVSIDILLDVLIDILKFDVNACCKRMTLLQHVCVPDTALAEGPYAAYCWNHGRDGFIKSLLDHGAKVNEPNALGHTPLHLACSGAKKVKEGERSSFTKILVSMVTLLLKHGAVVNVIDKRGNTPLHLACENGHVEIVQLLIDHGAYINARNGQSKTPYDMTSNETIRNCLCDYGYMPK